MKNACGRDTGQVRSEEFSNPYRHIKSTCLLAQQPEPFAFSSQPWPVRLMAKNNSCIEDLFGDQPEPSRDAVHDVHTLNASLVPALTYKQKSSSSIHWIM